MKIDLEKYIKSNRNQLDDVEHFDVDQMWNNFDQKKRPIRIRRMRPWYMMVAAVAVVLLGVTLFFNNTESTSQDDLVYQKLSEIDPELAAEQVSMIGMISEQDSLIKNLGITESQFPELFTELSRLDSLQIEMINDLSDYKSGKNLVRALLRHYEIKARALELMLIEFNRIETEKRYDKHSKI